MNIKELTNQLFDLSVGGYFNGEKFTKERLTTYITNMCQPPSTLHLDVRDFLLTAR